MATISKITHQIWMQGWDKLPEKFQENVRLLEELNPGFKHKKWDEESLRAECAKVGKEYLDKFNSFEEMITRVDYGRYIVLYQYGGISIDTDMKPLKPLDNIPGIDRDSFIISKNDGTAISNMLAKINITRLTNATILVSKQNPIMKEIIDTCRSDR